MFEIKFINTEDTYPIRLEVLRKNIDLPFKFDGDDFESTFHLGAFIDNELVGVSTFMKNSINDFKTDNQYQLRGMAILDRARGKGLGKKLLNKASEHLVKNKVRLFWCNAREEAVTFYSKQDFMIFGDAFTIKSIGVHYKMFKEL